MHDLGFEPLALESCIFISKDWKVCIMLYVDDMLIAAATKEQINHIANQLNAVFRLKALREV